MSKDAMNIAMDLDGTLIEYDGWKGHQHFGALLPGARDFLSACKIHGHRVWIYTARATDSDGSVEVLKWIDREGLDHLVYGVTATKLGIFDLFIDDRGMAFSGTFDGLLDQVLKFRQWWRAA